MPQKGDDAPAFDLPAEGDRMASLSDYRGRWLVLYFYPKDDTSGCTKQAIAFSEAQPLFAERNAAILGISRDPVAKHEKFRAKHGFETPLASDEEGRTVAAYGVWKEKNMYGKTYMGIERSTFLIDPDGKIAEVWRKVRVPGHVEKVLEALDAARG